VFASVTAQEAYDQATQHHRAGRVSQAATLYRQVLALAPDHADAWQMLGVAVFQLGEASEALDFIQRAIALDPAAARFHSNLGMVLANQGRREEAVAACRRAVSLRPDLSEAWENLSVVLHELGRRDEAVDAARRATELRGSNPAMLNKLGTLLMENQQAAEAIPLFQRALSLDPNLVEALNNLGCALQRQSDRTSAVPIFQRAIQLRPELPELHNNLGTALLAGGDPDAAIDAFGRALALRPDYPEAHFNLGNALLARHMLPDAIASYRKALAMRQDYAEAWHNLGNALKESGQFDESIDCYRKAVELGFKSFEVWGNLGAALRTTGDLDEAIECFRRGAEMKPRSVAAENLLYSIHLHPDYDSCRIFEEHASWNQQSAQALSPPTHVHANRGAADPDKRLRIGYVSPDFRRHPVGGFLLPLFSNHNRAQVEVCCYSDVRQPDPMTDELRRYASIWRDVAGLTDEQLADLVRADRIDILVDLAMHTENNRLLVFARKPAPIQLTYLAYCSTTGLTTMDYRLTDSYLDPPDGDDSVYSERSIRLAKTYWCYAPRPEAPPVGRLPALLQGHVTFGCLNNFAKVSRPTIAAWQGLLLEVSNSVLILHSHEGSHRQRLADRFSNSGIDPGRVVFVDRLSLGDYFAQYQRIDIALDTFPFNGGATTLDALWMGVPVVTLAGQTAVGRGGVGILSNAGLQELIAESLERYIQICRDLALDLPRLAHLRSTMRARIASSPLMDAKGFAQSVEAAYRQAWKQGSLIHT
jgi:protein O-GlcNAc transferase